MSYDFSLPLQVQREVHGQSVVVSARGEIDQNTVAALGSELRTAVALTTPPFPVVADLSGVTFLGSAGLNELLKHERVARASGISLRIAAAHRAVVRVIAASGLDEVLTTYPDVPRALSGREIRSAS
ncbi:anti-anti-sigma factor [Lentzea fradiae]|uniref:Anti-sigma factor antagonist n=1 Tax=Lentzea fradiae TaxID=200378 RepID=A0A1G7NIM5_9PSEU|nr:STAS domain-containing protein [Lentzea fradiae]SDF73149.1 anti-anti-sigma factor [Lentzea fradiae]